jgi:hypothetical protein
MAASLCPQPELSCDACVQAFLDEHPGAEVWSHTYHYCDCPMVADVGPDKTVCVGCGRSRDLHAEWWHGKVPA